MSNVKSYKREILDVKRKRQKKKNFKKKWKEEKLLRKALKTQTTHQDHSTASAVSDDSSIKDGRTYTISLALPGSILDNAQSPELRSYLAGQIARAVVIFNVDEVIVFDETNSLSKTCSLLPTHHKSNSSLQLARILQYLECPQYLRKILFPVHNDLRFAGLLNPLDTPHHMRADDKSTYREGVVLNKPVKANRGSYVNVGLSKEVQIDHPVQPGVRVTVQLDPSTHGKKMKGQAVAPSTPVTASGIYWGYSVRLASSLSAVFTECPFEGGYDLTIGTSERGSNVDEFDPPQFRHVLIVFGGVKGLEYSLDADDTLQLNDPSELFQYYLNTCPGQGSNTIRTEEAMLISLSALRPKLCNGKSGV